MARHRRFNRTKACAGDLRHVITIQSRTLPPASFDASDQPEPVFTSVRDVYAGVETVQGTRRWNGTNIDKRTTHLFFVRRDPAIENIDTGNNFIMFDSRRFRIFAITREAEDPYLLRIQAAERGDATVQAANA